MWTELIIQQKRAWLGFLYYLLPFTETHLLYFRKEEWPRSTPVPIFLNLSKFIFLEFLVLFWVFFSFAFFPLNTGWKFGHRNIFFFIRSCVFKCDFSPRYLGLGQPICGLDKNCRHRQRHFHQFLELNGWTIVVITSLHGHEKMNEEIYQREAIQILQSCSTTYREISWVRFFWSVWQNITILVCQRSVGKFSFLTMHYGRRSF